MNDIKISLSKLKELSAITCGAMDCVHHAGGGFWCDKKRTIIKEDGICEGYLKKENKEKKTT